MVAAVAYVDPGNVATNVAAGARHGYLLVWVLVLATLAAALLQYLSDALGAVTGASLPGLLGERLSGAGGWVFWGQAEVVAMATGVAEVVGGAVALDLLVGLPLPAGAVLTGLVSLLILAVRDRAGFATFELVVVGLLVVIAVGFGCGLVVEPPHPGAALSGLVPRFDGADSVCSRPPWWVRR